MQLGYLKSEPSTNANIETKFFAINMLSIAEQGHQLIQSGLAWTCK